MGDTQTIIADWQKIKDTDYIFHHFTQGIADECLLHDHPFFELLYVCSAGAAYQIEGRAYHPAPGDVLVTPPLTLHKTDVPADAPFDRFLFHMPATYLEHIADGMQLPCLETGRYSNLISPPAHCAGQIKTLCLRLEHLRQYPCFGNTLLKRAYLLELLVLLSQAALQTCTAADPPAAQDDKISNAVAYINAHFRQPLTVDQIADACGLSKYYLSNQFKKRTGLTLYQYMLRKRLSLARVQMEQGVPAMIASSQCGFGDYSNFLKAFKQTFGRSPRTYLQENGGP